MILVSSPYPVACHTDNIGPGSIFVAVPGYTTHGASYVETAIERGAKTIVLQKDNAGLYDQLCTKGFAPNVKYVFVPCARRALAQRAARAAKYPAKRLKLIAVTGSAHKTEAVHGIAAALRAEGHCVAELGAVKNCIDDRCEKGMLLTPPADYLQRFFAQCVHEGVTHVVMEVSANAVSLYRVHGLHFDHVVFTSLAYTPPSFYENAAIYLAAKKFLFAHRAPHGMAHIVAGPWIDKLQDVLPAHTNVITCYDDEVVPALARSVVQACRLEHAVYASASERVVSL